jgi:hypothetical protein
MDDGAGTLKLFQESRDSISTFFMDIGTVNYLAGTITITDLNITGLFDPELEFVFIPAVNDVMPKRQFIITLPIELIKVNVIANK